MNKILFLTMLVLGACSPTTLDERAQSLETCMCPCTCPIDTPPTATEDAAIDAQIDALVFDMSVPWPRHPILAATTARKGADGVTGADINGDGLIDLTSAWEQGNMTHVSLNPGCGASIDDPWPFVILPLATSAVEDAQFGQVDADGQMDVVSAGSSSFRVYVHFAPEDPADLLDSSAWTGITISSSILEQRVLKTVVGDLDNDGVNEIIAGGVGTNASIDVYRSNTPRVESSWTRQEVGPGVGVTYTLVLRHMNPTIDNYLDIVLSDSNGPTVLPNTYKGVRWLENPGLTSNPWVNHEIWKVGETRWAEVSADGRTIVSGTGPITGASTTVILTVKAGHQPEGPTDWDIVTVPQPSNVGQYNAAQLADIDNDGDLDLGIVYHHADGDKSNIVWLRNDDDTYTARGEVSGVDGLKTDNFLITDICGRLRFIATDEGTLPGPTTGAGLNQYENLVSPWGAQ